MPSRQPVTTLDPVAAKLARLEAVLAYPPYRGLSNREIARIAAVDEKTVRRRRASPFAPGGTLVTRPKARPPARTARPGTKSRTRSRAAP